MKWIIVFVVSCTVYNVLPDTKQFLCSKVVVAICDCTMGFNFSHEHNTVTDLGGM